MPDYRRFRVPGGTYFFTVNLLERRLDLLVRHIDLLRESVRITKVRKAERIAVPPYGGIFIGGSPSGIRPTMI